MKSDMACSERRQTSHSSSIPVQSSYLPCLRGQKSRVQATYSDLSGTIMHIPVNGRGLSGRRVGRSVRLQS